MSRNPSSLPQRGRVGEGDHASSSKLFLVHQVNSVTPHCSRNVKHVVRRINDNTALIEPYCSVGIFYFVLVVSMLFTVKLNYQFCGYTKKSTINLSIGCCLRNLKPSSCLRRRHCHRSCSVSVILLRKSRALSNIIGGTGVGCHRLPSPLPTSPR